LYSSTRGHQTMANMFDDLRVELHRFSDESVLRRLELCLDKVEGSKPG
jgi:hypothetical protein